MKSKTTSYQKMKQKYEERIRQLTDDIITLVEDEEFTKVMAVKMKWRMQLDLEKNVFLGQPISQAFKHK